MKPEGGFALQRVYTDDRSLDETLVCHNGDVVLVPRDHHPVSAPPGYDLYYLNVMAGPTREWKFKNDRAMCTHRGAERIRTDVVTREGRWIEA